MWGFLRMSQMRDVRWAHPPPRLDPSMIRMKLVIWFWMSTLGNSDHVLEYTRDPVHFWNESSYGVLDQLVLHPCLVNNTNGLIILFIIPSLLIVLYFCCSVSSSGKYSLLTKTFQYQYTKIYSVSYTGLP